MSALEDDYNEGIDYISLETLNVLENPSLNVRADNYVINLMARDFNQQIKEKELTNKFFVCGQDLLSAIREDDIQYTKGNNRYNVLNYYMPIITNKNLEYVFIFLTLFNGIDHTVLLVLNRGNNRTRIDCFDSQHDNDEKTNKLILEYRDLLKKVCNLKDCGYKNFSSYMAQQENDDTCAYYCMLAVEKFINMGEYNYTNGSIKKFTLKDVKNLKERYYQKFSHSNLPKLTDKQVGQLIKYSDKNNIKLSTSEIIKFFKAPTEKPKSPPQELNEKSKKQLETNVKRADNLNNVVATKFHIPKPSDKKEKKKEPKKTPSLPRVRTNNVLPLPPVINNKPEEKKKESPPIPKESLKVANDVYNRLSVLGAFAKALKGLSFDQQNRMVNTYLNLVRKK